MVVTGFFLCVFARKRVMAVALAVFYRVWDDEFSSHFYANSRTGESSWTKPRVLLTNEPLILLSEDQKKMKRSPRLNRERLEVEERTLPSPSTD
jgi:hypothetical protein